MSTEWTLERHEDALAALDQSMCQWCSEFADDALDEIERLRAECQRLANETKHPAWANITEDMVERAAEEFWDRPTETAPTATRMRLITRAALEAALGKANQ